MADNENAAEQADPKTVQMPRAVHEIRTGKKPDDVIEAGELITEKVAKEHKLDEKTLAALEKSGAVELVDVLRG